MSLIVATHHVVYYRMDTRHPGIKLPLLFVCNMVMDTHRQNDTCVTLIAGAPFMLQQCTSRLTLFMPFTG
jgi:hypothetical protein